VNAIITQDQAGFLAPAVTVQKALEAYQAKKELIDGIMKSGVDFGVIPGSSKPTLLKAGAEKATSFFGLSPHFKDAGVVEDWTGADHNGEPFFYYRRTCELWRGDHLVASVDGSCNSWEKKYRYRSSERVCPNCGKPTIIKGKQEYGGGWICFLKKGGCGAKFFDGDKTIEGQEVGQVKNADIADQVNTLLKMADKRALVAATLIATGLSEYFTQDIEDYTVIGDVIEGDVKAKTQPENISQETDQPTKPIEIIDAMSEKAVTLAANKWNISKPEAAKELSKKKLGKMGKSEFIEWLDNPS
jgi:predicted RNA-binding Zn-ribbon protein involved in translation (DUF1610 family)